MAKGNLQASTVPQAYWVSVLAEANAWPRVLDPSRDILVMIPPQVSLRNSVYQRLFPQPGTQNLLHSLRQKFGSFSTTASTLGIPANSFMMRKTVTENRHRANRQTRIVPAGSLYPVGPSPAQYNLAEPGVPLSEGGTEGGEDRKEVKEAIKMKQIEFRPGDAKQTVRHICLLSLLPGNKAVLFHVVYQPRLVSKPPRKVFCFVSSHTKLFFYPLNNIQ